jgi:L-fucose isomerase-like protein
LHRQRHQSCRHHTTTRTASASVSAICAHGSAHHGATTPHRYAICARARCPIGWSSTRLRCQRRPYRRGGLRWHHPCRHRG